MKKRLIAAGFALWALVMLGHAVAFALVGATGKDGRLLVLSVASFAALNLVPAYLYFIWLPRGLVVRHLPPDVLPALHLAPLFVLVLAALGAALVKAGTWSARWGEDQAG